VSYLQPKVLDLRLSRKVVRIQVTGNPYSIFWGVERTAQQTHPDSHHLLVRIREAQRMAVLVSLGPVQQARSNEVLVGEPYACPAFLLMRCAARVPLSNAGRCAVPLRVERGISVT
jgi:hypothetical protein